MIIYGPWGGDDRYQWRLLKHWDGENDGLGFQIRVYYIVIDRAFHSEVAPGKFKTLSEAKEATDQSLRQRGYIVVNTDKDLRKFASLF